MTKMTPVKGTGRKPGIASGTLVGERGLMCLSDDERARQTGPYIMPSPSLSSGAPVTTILPIRHQRQLPLDRLIIRDPPDPEAMEMDVVIVGAGPAGLACAIELTRLAKRERESGGAMPEPSI